MSRYKIKAKHVCGKWGHDWEYKVGEKKCRRCGKFKVYTPNLHAVYREGFQPRWKK